MTFSLNSKHGRSMTTHGFVLQALRDGILDGSVAGGTRLIQADLARELDVSITPVREALRDLATEGLVVFDPHRGFRVRTLNLAEVQELYELRMTLEPLTVRRVAESVSDDQLDRAEELREAMEHATNVSEWSELNRQFHAVLVEGDRGSRLAQIVDGLRDSASAYVGLSLSASPERITESDREHAQLIELYRRKDIDGAVALTVQHLHTTLSTIEEAYERGLL